MKKAVKKLRLAKETLARLDEEAVQQVKGGTRFSIDIVPYDSSCPGCA